jgi:hypothetical protein
LLLANAAVEKDRINAAAGTGMKAFDFGMIRLHIKRRMQETRCLGNNGLARA